MPLIKKQNNIEWEVEEECYEQEEDAQVPDAWDQEEDDDHIPMWDDDARVETCEDDPMVDHVADAREVLEQHLLEAEAKEGPITIAPRKAPSTEEMEAEYRLWKAKTDEEDRVAAAKLLAEAEALANYEANKAYLAELKEFKAKELAAQIAAHAAEEEAKAGAQKALYVAKRKKECFLDKKLDFLEGWVQQLEFSEDESAKLESKAAFGSVGCPTRNAYEEDRYNDEKKKQSLLKAKIAKAHAAKARADSKGEEARKRQIEAAKKMKEELEAQRKVYKVVVAPVEEPVKAKETREIEYPEEDEEVDEPVIVAATKPQIVVAPVRVPILSLKRIEEGEFKQVGRTQAQKLEQVAKSIALVFAPKSYEQTEEYANADMSHVNFVQAAEVPLSARTCVSETKAPTCRKFTRLCESLTKNIKCRHGARCNFAHSLDQLVQSPCRFGQKCRYAEMKGEGVFANTDPARVCSFWHTQETCASYGARMGVKVAVTKPLAKSQPTKFEVVKKAITPEPAPEVHEYVAKLGTGEFVPLRFVRIDGYIAPPAPWKNFRNRV